MEDETNYLLSTPANVEHLRESIAQANRMKSKDVVETILKTCREIKNSRNRQSVFEHLEGEVQELKDELISAQFGMLPGEDGVIGEGVDVMLCAIDAIFINNPAVTTEEIMEVVVKKLAKWKRLYGNA